MTKRKFKKQDPTASMKLAVEAHLDIKPMPDENSEWTVIPMPNTDRPRIQKEQAHQSKDWLCQPITIDTVEVRNVPVYFLVGGKLSWAFEYRLNGETFLFHPDTGLFLVEAGDDA